jgi:type 1 glutamine amidotransferase
MGNAIFLLISGGTEILQLGGRIILLKRNKIIPRHWTRTGGYSGLIFLSDLGHCYLAISLITHFGL